ncbi:Hypothetical predicted protein [Xyrichtys novacula]|uniref:Histone H2A n=1 Tax=Xyrichtys novacula TaxID=13765 RepID=A0AAV1HSQ5_XYRNO|nr:Hypothetical predicted protein [Xyrichtys novacula]
MEAGEVQRRGAASQRLIGGHLAPLMFAALIQEVIEVIQEGSADTTRPGQDRKTTNNLTTTEGSARVAQIHIHEEITEKRRLWRRGGGFR